MLKFNQDNFCDGQLNRGQSSSETARFIGDSLLVGRCSSYHVLSCRQETFLHLNYFFGFRTNPGA